MEMFSTSLALCEGNKSVTGGFHSLRASVGKKRRTHRTFPMARPKCLMGDFTNFYGIYKAHQTNVR